MATTSSLLHRFMREGRPDKVQALHSFIEIVEDYEGEELVLSLSEDDEDVIMVRSIGGLAFHTEPDYNQN